MLIKITAVPPDGCIPFRARSVVNSSITIRQTLVGLQLEATLENDPPIKNKSAQRTYKVTKEEFLDKIMLECAATYAVMQEELDDFEYLFLPADICDPII